MFAANAAIDIQDRIWAADQKIEKRKNGTGIIIDFSSTQFEKVLPWVLSYGMSAKPLKPIELVKEWKRNILGLYEKVKND
jgi:hypothetical protein